ncbi:MAG: SDR family oxidoreductase [Candidatus Bipolaricaulota bacterium]|nr:SDR family oxidoreductase [Candidatus Bipolaricaulota bacterium]
MDLGLAGKVGIVAAASKGLGKAVAKRLAHEGMKLAICARDETTLHATAHEISSLTQTEVLPIRADVTRPDDIKNLVAEAVRRFGGLDVLVTNAGGPPPGNFFAFDDSAWEQAFSLTLMSVVRLCREAIPYMQQRGGGRIINIASVSVKQPLENLILSNSLRLAVVGLAKSLANELAPFKITVNTVCPGPTQTDRMEQLLRAMGNVEEARRFWTKDIPMGRMGQPEELADLVAFLASENARYITGTVIHVDGGLVKGIF